MIRNVTGWTTSLAVLVLNLIAMPSGFANAIPAPILREQQHSDNRPMIVAGCVVVVAIIVSILAIKSIVRNKNKNE